MDITVLFLLLVSAAPHIRATNVYYRRERAGLPRIPVEDIGNTTTHLLLRYNLITEIEENTFLGFDQLAYIYLTSNRISVIADSAFNGTRLSYLAIDSNRLTALPKLDAVGSTLHTLFAHNNQIERLEDDVLSGLTRLITLYLYNNQIERLAAGVFNDLTSLTTLDLSSNQIERLGVQVFSGCVRMVTLNLHSNMIKQFGADVFNGLTRLTNLNLQHNQIERLQSDDLRHLPALKTLDLRYNQMTSIAPDVLTGISPPLAGLYISNNRLTDINFLGSPNLSYDNRISYLYLDGNYMNELPTNAFERLLSVTHLGMVSTGLTEIPNLINQRLNLRYLYLSWNLITVIRKDAFDGFNLVQLDLDNNRLVDVSYLFHPLISISTLYLNDNNIGPIDISHINRPITGLTSLNLQNNDLGVMPCDDMMRFLELLPHLTTLYLQSTGLETFPDISMLNHRLTHLYLLNPRTMRCDCSLVWMRNITQMVTYTDIAPTSRPCGSPRRLVGNEWSQVTEEDLCQGEVVTSCGRYIRTLPSPTHSTGNTISPAVHSTASTEQSTLPTKSPPSMGQSDFTWIAAIAGVLGLLLLAMIVVVIVLLVRRKSPASQVKAGEMQEDKSSPNDTRGYAELERRPPSNTYDNIQHIRNNGSV